MKEKSAKQNHSVEKVFQIIEIMAETKGPARLQDISAKARLPTSTALRFLSTLQNCGYVSQDPETLKYSLTLKFCRIGDLVSSQVSIRDVARPFLEELSTRCGESACLAIEHDSMAVYIDVADGPDNMLKTLQRIGKRAPLHCTGVGKLMLLNYDREKIARLVSQAGLTVFTKNTISTEQELLAELDKVRAQGYALDNEECEIGARCVAAPIRDYTGKIVACISVSGPVSRLNMKRIDSIRETVKEISLKISKKLGYATGGSL